MEHINNLESLKIDDYVKYYLDEADYRKNYFIAKVEIINQKEIILGTLRETRNTDGKDLHYFWSDEIKKTIIKKVYEKIKKKKLRGKEYSFNNRFIIFKLSGNEKNKFIKEVILHKLK